MTERAHPELERAIVAEPGDAERYLVYADWLIERGDARGELIALSVAAERDPRREEQRDRAIAEYAKRQGLDGVGELTWRRGFIDQVTIHDEDPQTVRGLLACPAMRLVRELAFARAPATDENLMYAIDDWTRRPEHLTSLDAVAELRNLEALRLTGQRIVDLAPLRSLTKLRVLGVAETDVASLEPLTHLPALRMLSLRYTPTHDLTPLTALSELSALNIGATQVRDISPVWGLEHLRYLNLTRVPLTADDLPELRRLPRLKSLDLAEARISTIEPLADLRALRDLCLNSSAVTDVSPLHALPALRYLEVFSVPPTTVLEMLAARARVLPGGPPLIVVAAVDELEAYGEGMMEWIQRDRDEDDRLWDLIV